MYTMPGRAPNQSFQGLDSITLSHAFLLQILYTGLSSQQYNLELRYELTVLSEFLGLAAVSLLQCLI